MSETELTQTEYADLQKYVPASDTVKMVFSGMLNQEIDNWDEAVQKMIDDSLDGDQESLFNLLELTYLNAHNEGMLEARDESSF